MPRKKEPITFSIRMTVLGVFLFVASLTAGLALSLQYYFSHDLAQTAARNSFRSMSEKIRERVNTLDNQSVNLLGILGHFHELESFPIFEQERHIVTLLGGAIKNTPSIYGIYVGYDTGDFFEVINLESTSNIRESYRATPLERWLVIKVQNIDGHLVKKTAYLNDSFTILRENKETTTYDPRKRPWFLEALATPGIIKTAPYIFSHLQAPGVTYAKRMSDGQRVIAVDISLAGLAEFLKKQRFQPHSQAFLFDDKGEIIASASQKEITSPGKKSHAISLSREEARFISDNPVIKASNERDWPPFDFAKSGQPQGYSVELLSLLAEKAGFRVEYINGYSWEEMVTLFKEGDLDLLHSLTFSKERQEIGVFSNQYIAIPRCFAVKQGVRLPSSLTELAGKTVSLPKGWATVAYLEQNFPEIEILQVETTLEAMQAVASGRAYATLDFEHVLHYLARSYFLSSVIIGGHPKELAKATDQGLHFLVHPEKKQLTSILNKALAAITSEELAGMSMKWLKGNNSPGVITGSPTTIPHPQLLKLSATDGSSGDLQLLPIEGEQHFAYVSRMDSIYGAHEFLGLLVPVEETLTPYLEKVRFSSLVTLALLLFLAPIVWYCATKIVRPINALALENEKVRKRNYNEVNLVESKITEIVSLSQSMVAMASAIKAHEASLNKLMESLLKLIAVAIDQKSPYTSGHCARVPELSIMLAQAAHDSKSKPFSDFSLDTEDEWQEFRIAAWLHDCGKLTTPEHIVDKATKLETIYNRIHEIRMRFEVLLRDSEIQYWKGLVSGIDESLLKKQLTEKQQEIKDNFTFIANCNLGGEEMSPERLRRLQKIATITWMRHLDDRLGLGHLESKRYPANAPGLPIEEPLLADRPEHLIQHPEYTQDTSSSSFAMKARENLYNLGEIHNLSVTNGTLTEEDRYKVKEHILTTILMLETLPYPENLTKIPEYAGAHHETLTGTGYPRKLTAKEITIPARIMAIADIFEALTASDRPYKKANRLSEALEILKSMVNGNHLDRDLFTLFLRSGVYLDYADLYLHPDQIDEVNINNYL